MIVAPEITKPGSVCHEPVISTDFYPTLLALTRTPPKPSQTLDGRSLVPLLKDPHSSLDRPSLYWHYPHYSNQGGFPEAPSAPETSNWSNVTKTDASTSSTSPMTSVKKSTSPTSILIG